MKRIVPAAFLLCASLGALAATQPQPAADAAQLKADYLHKRADCNVLTGKERKDCLFDARVKYKAAMKTAQGDREAGKLAVDAQTAAAAEASHAQ